MGGPGMDDPAGAWDEGALPSDTLAKMKRVPTIVAILRQLDRVNYLLSCDADAATAVQALYVLASPYLKKLQGWQERWDALPCAADGDDPMPTPSDVLAWYQAIMDGLGEAKVIFDEVRLSYVGEPRTEKEQVSREGPELLVGPVGVGGGAVDGSQPGARPTGLMGGRVDKGHDNGPGPPGGNVVPRVDAALRDGVGRGPEGRAGRAEAEAEERRSRLAGRLSRLRPRPTPSPLPVAPVKESSALQRSLAPPGLVSEPAPVPVDPE